jgi:hypothetical protein
MADILQLSRSLWINLDQIISINDAWQGTPPVMTLRLAGTGNETPYDLRLSPQQRTAMLDYLAMGANKAFCQPDAAPDDTQSETER